MFNRLHIELETETKDGTAKADLVRGFFTWKLGAFIPQGTAATRFAAFAFSGSPSSPWKGGSWGNNDSRGNLSQFGIQRFNFMLLATLQILNLFKMSMKDNQI